jgi:hypothetical protein
MIPLSERTCFDMLQAGMFTPKCIGETCSKFEICAAEIALSLRDIARIEKEGDLR